MRAEGAWHQTRRQESRTRVAFLGGVPESLLAHEIWDASAGFHVEFAACLRKTDRIIGSVEALLV
jgi:hypothetical protein